MTQRQPTIVQKDDPILRTHAQAVPLADIGTKKLNEVIARMNAALNAEPDGVAIAAPQIGVPLRIFIISGHAFDIAANTHGGSAADEKRPGTLRQNKVFINPEIVKRSKKKIKVPEGCLSVRWLYGNTMRHEKVSIRAYDEKGKRFTLGGTGLIAQIFQHETDHLNGILFIDHATDLEELAPEHAEAKEARDDDHTR